MDPIAKYSHWLVSRAWHNAYRGHSWVVVNPEWTDGYVEDLR